MQAKRAEILRSKAGVEWQTVLVIAACWLAYGLLTYYWQQLGWLIVAPVGAFLLCLYGSLQHEAAHGHPTRNALINEALVSLPIGLLFPYRRYRSMHITHHDNDHITDPARDPESYYLEPEVWARLPNAVKWLGLVNNTMLGRLILGPSITAVLFITSELRLIFAGDIRVAGEWAMHLIGLVLVWLWVSGVCGMPFWQYIAGMAYGGLSLTLMRSFAEHRAHEAASCRTIVIESNPLISLMFLNNNLHMAHHEQPGLAWYRLPSYYRANKQRLIERNCGYLVKGYGRLFADFALKPKEPLAHPLPDSLTPREG